MKATLIVEGKEFPIEINDPELQKLIAPPKKTGYERVPKDTVFYYVSCDDEVVAECDERTYSAKDSYDIANYYSSYEIAENNARADRLMRQLRRFAVECRSVGIDWDKKDMTKWAIYYNRTEKELEAVTACNAHYYGTIYFDLALHAHEAIAAFHDELIWYFTEYKDSL